MFLSYYERRSYMEAKSINKLQALQRKFGG